MPTDWESILRSWVKRPSDNEESKRDRTEKEIRAALSASDALKNISYKVYAKGSYANNTNVRLDYDVDIAIECNEFYYYDSQGAPANIEQKLALVESRIPAYKGGYTHQQFKADVEAALVAYYGSSAVTRGNMAMRVREKKTTLPADVVPCYEYHYNYNADFAGNPVYHQGTRVYRDSGGHIDNWPVQQKSQGNLKNSLTAKRYKRMVRALKRLENTLVDRGLIDDLPSFFIECLVYNVPNDRFNHTTYVADMRSVLAYIFNETMSATQCNEWTEVNERKWLFRPSQGWNFRQAHQLADAAWDYIGFE
ncbi:nucleotidyltransferase [Pseudonocardia kongjuensis]|uniref:Nucleotidyltransferase n=1 Tax=Pseudonocardia kongjuensis TaxID=102227 RepID=A0ABN1Y173_9PSEU